MGEIHYLCGMLYLKTPTSELTTSQLRRVVCETIKWCETNIGDKPTRKKSFKFCVRTLPSGYTPAYGCYDYNINTLFVFRNHAMDIRMVIRAVLHEYTHFMQNLRYYHNVLSKVGYDQHPLEKQARAMEYFYSYCWKDIKRKLR